MMEETQTIYAAGAGAVTKLVEQKSKDPSEARIERIFNPKYPYEYLREAEQKKNREVIKKSLKEHVLEFFSK